MIRLVDIYSTGSSSLGRSLVAFIVAPLMSSLLVVSAVVLFYMLGIPGEPPGLLLVLFGFIGYALLGTLMLGAPFTYIGMVLIGFPSWLVLRFTNNESAVAYALLGAFGGWWLAPELGGHKWAGMPLDWIGACAGALTMCISWRTARRR